MIKINGKMLITSQNLDHCNQSLDLANIVVKVAGIAIILGSFDPFDHPIIFNFCPINKKLYILIIELSLFGLLLPLQHLECLSILFIS